MKFKPNTLTTVQATTMFRKAILDSTGVDMPITVAIKAESSKYTTYTVHGISTDPFVRVKTIVALKKLAASLPFTNIEWR